MWAGARGTGGAAAKDHDGILEMFLQFLMGMFYI